MKATLVYVILVQATFFCKNGLNKIENETIGVVAMNAISRMSFVA